VTTITIDDKTYEIKEGQNLLQAALSLGFDLPYFCWHPALGSVGACRQCAVKQFKDANDTEGKLVMACMTPASNGTRIAIQDPEAREFRASVVEWLMVNHPHDCPVCDEGGECHLQDMTVMTGHNYRSFRFQKRTHRNQDLGPFINHEMNRCIACYRCVRFYRDYAGGRDFDVFAAHDNVYFGRHEDGPLENEFSGNLVEVCPTGVFTDKTLHEHYTRKWDLQTAPSVCTGCSLGCNIIPGERYGTLRRIRNRYNHEVNGYFLCDRGRFGYEFVNSERRVRQPILRSKNGRFVQTITPETAVAHLADMLQDHQPVIGIGSPRASLEANFALQQLVGADYFYSGMAADEHRLVQTAVTILQATPARLAAIRDCETSDAALVLGEDLTNTAPRLALALRQAAEIQPMHILAERRIPVWEEAAALEAIQNRTGPLFIATAQATKLDDVARQTFRAAPDDVARLGFAVAHALDAAAPPVPDLTPDEATLAQTIADALQTAQNPLVIAGTSSGSAAILQAAANVANALHANGRSPQIALVLPENNSLGVALLDGRPLDEALVAVATGAARSVIILENDLFRRAPRDAVAAFLQTAEDVVVLEHLSNDTTLQADLILPAATFAEDSGTLVNNEGRAQRFFQVFAPADAVKSSWQWLGETAVAAGREAPRRLDDWIRLLAHTHPALQGITEAAPDAAFRIVGQKIPRQPERYSGRTSMHADTNVSEPKPPQDPNTPLAFSMEGYEGQPPAALVPRYWSPGWNSVQALNKFQEEVAGPLRGGDAGRRLIEPAGQAMDYFQDIPAAFRPRPSEWLTVPLHHIFGSEPLSMLTPGVAERAPQPYVAFNPADAAAQGWQEGETAVLDLDFPLALPVKILPSLPQGTAGLPAGFFGYWPGAQWIRVTQREGAAHLTKEIEP